MIKDRGAVHQPYMQRAIPGPRDGYVQIGAMNLFLHVVWPGDTIRHPVGAFLEGVQFPIQPEVDRLKALNLIKNGFFGLILADDGFQI